MTYKLSLAKRRAVQARRNERYRTDPAYRLVRVNEKRARDGKPLLASLDEVELRVPVSG